MEAKRGPGRPAGRFDVHTIRFRASEETWRRLKAIASRLGVTQSEALRRAVEQMAEREGITGEEQ